MTSNEHSPRSLRARLLDALPAPARDAVSAIVAAHGGRGVYAVGGIVRDLLLGRAIVDVDLVVEGDAVAVARTALPGTKLVAHARFGTASMTIAHARIDVATARSETYARPGALPRVRPAGIDEDLRRRDFSVNAIALRLDGEPALLDPCGGIADLAARRLRVLHDRAFADDATRIFRALRYAARLGFALDAHTATLLRDGVGHVTALSGERVRREIELILMEQTAGVALEACQATGALRAVHPALRWDVEKRDQLDAERVSGVARTTLGLALLASAASAAEAEVICARLRLTRAEASAVRAMPALAPITAMLRRASAKPSGVVALLDHFPPAAVAAFAGTAPDSIARQLALRYLEEWRHIKPILSGRDLQELGVPAGPQVQRGLQLIRAARLDGWASDRGDERALALRFVKSIRDSGAMTSDVEVQLGD